MGFKFEKLEIWKLAVELADRVHLLTRKFPKEEMFSLTSQMKRAADSVSLNIAEGSTGQSDPEQSRFIGYSLRSVLEVVNCDYLALRRKYITNAEFDELYIFCEQLIIKIQAFRRTIKT